MQSWLPILLGLSVFLGLTIWTAVTLGRGCGPLVLWHANANEELGELTRDALERWGLGPDTHMEAASPRTALLLIQKGPCGGDPAWTFTRDGKQVIRISEVLLTHKPICTHRDFWVGVLTAALAVPLGARPGLEPGRLVAVNKPSEKVAPMQKLQLRERMEADRCPVARGL